MEWENASLTEFLWLALCLSGVWHGWRLYRPIRDDIELLASGTVQASPGARALFRNDAATEVDWMVMYALMGLAALPAMLRDNAPPTWTGWATLVLLFAALLWTRWRAVHRGQRRAAIKHRIAASQTEVTR